MGELGGEHLRTQVCCSSPGQSGAATAGDRWAGPLVEVSRRAQTSTAANRLPENAPHAEAGTSTWGTVAGKRHTLTCLREDPLQCTQALFLPCSVYSGGGLWLGSSFSCDLWRAPYVLDIMTSSLCFIYNSHADSSQLTGGKNNSLAHFTDE